MNILISREPATIKIADFGLAVDTEITRLTTDGKVFGTLAYMAPEQVLGRQDRIDARTDIYALGATLFELLTLELPYEGSTQQLYMDAVLKSEARRPSRINDRVSRDLEIVIRKSLEKNPRDRYATAAAFADDLENVLHLRPIIARSSGIHKRVMKWARRKPVHAILVGVLAIGTPTVVVLTQRAVEHQGLLEEVRIRELETEIRWFIHRLRHRDVIEVTSEILTLNPRHINALVQRGVSNLRLAQSAQNTDRASEFEKRSLADFSTLIDLRPDASWPHRWRAWVLAELGREQEAQESNKRASELQSDHPEDEELYLEALRARDAGDHELAVQLSSELIVRRPNWGDILMLRGGVYAATGELDKAADDYRVLLAVDPDNYLNYYELAELLKQGGSLEEAEAYFRRALELAPNSFLLREGLAHNHLQSGTRLVSEGDAAAASHQFEEAEREAREGLGLNPDAPWLHINLGLSLVEQQRIQDSPDTDLIAEAVEHYDVALSMWEAEDGTVEPGSFASAALVNQCDALIELRDLDRAMESCLNVTRVSPKNPNGYYNLAGVYALMDRPDDAFRALDTNFRLGDRDHLYLSSDKWFEGLREDPRFNDLIIRMKGATSHKDN
jgi:tetratricopeptide (TPR) repeat protein